MSNFVMVILARKIFRTKADKLIYNTEEIVKLDKEIKELNAMREKYNFYVKVNSGKIGAREFIDKYVELIVVFTKYKIKIEHFE